ncbi:MAG: zinc ribbon domain-containing protein, partial [Variovorax sp.]
MALVCPSCGTENRSVAKFCIECIAALPVGFEATQLAPRPAPRESPASEGMPTALAAFAAAPPSQPQAWVRSPAPPIPPAPPAPEAKGRTGLWVSVGALAIALVVGAAGWAAAGAGGWYIYKEKVSSSGEEREPAVTQAAPSVGDSVRAPVAATSMAA